MASAFIAVCAVLLDRWLGEPLRLHFFAQAVPYTRWSISFFESPRQ